jgi:hypothetical protein
MGKIYTFSPFTKLLTVLLLLTFNQSIGQTLMPLPPHASVYTGSIRGYWFTAPCNFTITGLRVAAQAGTGLQYIHVFKINDATPVVYPTSSSNFTTLTFISGAPNNVIQTVNIAVVAGDKIGILGQAGTSNSYGSVTGPTTINGFSVTLARLLYQGNLTTSPAPNYSTEPTSASISRVEMYYSTCAVPTGVSATGITMNNATLNWNPVAGSTGYEYAITTTATPPASGTPTAATTYNASGLLPGTTYYFHVRNFCSATNSSSWTTISFVTATCPGPTGVNATGITMNDANLSWNAVAGSLGYEYALTTTPTPPASGTPTSGLTYAASGLNNGTTYYFHVRSQCNATSWSYFTTYSFTTVACATPTGVAATGVTLNSANLNWNAVAGSLGYEYALTTTATPPAAGTPTSATSYNATGLNVNATYYFHVRNKCNATSNSLWSTISFSTLPCPAAGTPSITNNVPGIISYSWTGSTVNGVTDYQYAVTPTAAAPTTWTTTSATSATVSGLVPGSTYYAQVRTNCSSATSGWQSVMFVNPFPPCYRPANIFISEVNMHGAAIKWNLSTTVPQAQDYQYVVQTSPTPPPSGTTTPDTFYNVVNLLPNTTYYVFVRTHCSSTNYSIWDTATFTTPATCLPVVSPNITNVTTNSADISWNHYPGVSGYEYFINNISGSPGFSGYPIAYNAVSPVLLNSGTVYYFHLRVKCDTANYSPWVNSMFETLPLCTPPSTPTVSNVTQSSATFSWNTVPGAASYEYSIGTNPNPPSFGPFTSNTNITINNLLPSTMYYFHLRAYCSSSDVSSWKTVSVLTGTTDVPNVAGNDPLLLKVFPNPVKNWMNLEVQGKIHGTAHIAVMDMSGRVVLTREVDDLTTELDFSHLSNGMYLLRFSDNENIATIRVEKQ